MQTLTQSQLISAMKHNGFTFERLSSGLLFTKANLGIGYTVTNAQINQGCEFWNISDLGGYRVERITDTLADWIWFKLPSTTSLSPFEQQMIEQEQFLSTL